MLRKQLLPIHLNASALLWALILILAPVSLGRPAPDFTQTPQTQRAPPFPPTQYVPDHDFDTRHIALDLRFNWELEQLIGSETIVFAPLITNLRRIELDAANMTFLSVKLSSGTPLKYEADVANQKLKIALDRAYQPSDELMLVIEYNTNGAKISFPAWLEPRFDLSSPLLTTRQDQNRSGRRERANTTTIGFLAMTIQTTSSRQN